VRTEPMTGNEPPRQDVTLSMWYSHDCTANATFGDVKVDKNSTSCSFSCFVAVCTMYTAHRHRYSPSPTYFDLLWICCARSYATNAQQVEGLQMRYI